MQEITLTFQAVEEDEPGLKWQQRFEAAWPEYRSWFLREGDAARPTYAHSIRMLRTHMPELVPIYERLVELAGGGDVAARMLALVNPPPYLAGCSQGVLVRDRPVLVRNYDYAPSRLECVIQNSGWAGRRVIGMSDCLWGLLDGMNDAGLAVSLAFGGRPVLGEGFGVQLVVRYLLQVCETVAEAREVLTRLPYQLAHSLTLADAGGEVVTAYLAPDRDVVFRASPVATNHQDVVEWTEHAAVTRTLEREALILRLVSDPETTDEALVAAFLHPPLYSSTYSRGFGTLYTAVYRPAEGRVEYLWPGAVWPQSFDRFREGTHVEVLIEASVA